MVEVQCTGMFHPQAIGDLVAKGATSVQIVGCAPGECAYGIGNELTSLGVQIHGGMGYVEETGAAQHFRDIRISVEG